MQDSQEYRIVLDGEIELQAATITGKQPYLGPLVEVIQLEHYPVDTETGEMYDIPKFATDSSAAVDFRSAEPHDVVLAPNQSYTFRTGICYNMMSSNVERFGPFRMCALVLPRSGMGFKLFTRLANTAGLIDQDYQKEIMVKIRNEGTETFTIKVGERFCQTMFLPVFVPNFVKVSEFSESTERGGFGSTGTK